MTLIKKNNKHPMVDGSMYLSRTVENNRLLCTQTCVCTHGTCTTLLSIYYIYVSYIYTVYIIYICIMYYIIMTF